MNRSWGRVGLAATVGGALLAVAASAQPQASSSRRVAPCDGARLDPAWSDRRKVVQLAVCEWARFGYPTVEIRPTDAGEANALPSALGLSQPLRRAAGRGGPDYQAVVPAIQVQTRFGATESDYAASSSVESYWQAVRPAFVAEVRRQRAAIDHSGGKSNLYPGWWEPWSGAFVSWVLQSAGVSWFRGSASHVLYLKAAIAARPGSVVQASRYRPLPGDLICTPRGGGNAEPKAVSEAGFIAALKEGTDHFDSHCDIIVRVNHTSVVSIGGNVNNAVTATVTPLRKGRLMRSNVRPWSAALKLGEPYDPCARIESAPLRDWSGEGKARRLALARTGCR